MRPRRPLAAITKLDRVQVMLTLSAALREFAPDREKVAKR